ncbi:hypothetical protein N431DRAFT_328897 [Stipitochalara longipes BDJ]|nr:hypothetical protein N431DRAFT_328897 [Stipitochalara longipes BDJ]
MSSRPRRVNAGKQSYTDRTYDFDCESEHEAVDDPEDNEPDGDDPGGDDNDPDLEVISDEDGFFDSDNGDITNEDSDVNSEDVDINSAGSDLNSEDGDISSKSSGINSEDEGRSAKRAKLNHVVSNLGTSRPLKRKPGDNAQLSRKRARTTLDANRNPRSFGDPGNTFNFDNPLDYHSPPLTTTRAIFQELTKQIYHKTLGNLEELCGIFACTPLKVLTFCSGTESPILGLQMVQKFLASDFGKKLMIQHEGSAEIQPEKAAYIQRNFPSKVILRDIIEFVLGSKDSEKPLMMTTMYGGKVEVPEGIDLLVAGFCCDDFSTLNNVRKTLQQKGESGDTFFALVAYMKMYHPLLAVLENVIGAPWVAKYNKSGKRIYDKKKNHIQDQSIAEILDEAGYYTIFIRVDTKEYYLPQTRIRGYMVCVLKDAISPRLWAKLEPEFSELMANLKRPASAPVEAFLFTSDDPSLKALHIESKGDRKPVSWDKCSMNHEEYRRHLGLGAKHPLTNMKPDGSTEMPDHHVAPSNATERVKDSLDIAHMRNAQRGLDDRYSNRQLELSQNVYRVQDTVRTGVQQCLTPTNIAFSTWQGRKLTGAEAANLQGIDLGQVNVSNMTESLLHDMCGNAMSSPLVTAVMLAALVTFRSALKIKGREMAQVQPEPQPSTEGREFLLVSEANSFEYKPVSVEEITKLALETIRLCLCEARYDIFATQFQRCRVCHHVTCVKCGKQPRHEYELLAMPFIEKRSNPIKFEDLIKESVPMVIDLGGLYSTEMQKFLDELKKFAASKEPTTWRAILKAFNRALLSRVHFRCVRRTEVWTITWDSPSAILKLIINGNSVEWRLYANVSTQPLGSEMGQYLRQYPIAHMIPNGDDIVKGTWACWCPIEKEFEATITSSGPLNPTYKNKCGLVNNLNDFNHSILELQIKNYDPRYFDSEIRGHYIAAPDCGQAFNTMHIRKSEVAVQKPLGLYFAHAMLGGDPAHHSFILGSDLERKDWGEYPVVAGRLSSSWRQPIVAAGIDNENGSRALVHGVDSTVQEYKAVITDDVKIVVDGRFIDLGANTLNLTGPIFEYRHLPKDVHHLRLSCGHQFSIFECKGNIDQKISSSLPSNIWNIIGQGDRTHFWHELLWLVLRYLKIDGHQEADSIWHPFADVLQLCAECAPRRPPLLWKFNKKMKNTPFEHPQHAADWETDLRGRPSPMTVIFRGDDLGHIDLRVSMDAATLMHRAKALLLGNGDDSHVDLSWRLVTDDGRDRKPKNNPLELLNNDKGKTACQPFATFELRPEQLRVLAWMQKQEAEGTKFLEEEIVEALVPEIGYRAEGRATREVTRRGGILAQDVGFGKTVVVLGLIKESREAPKKETTWERAEIPAGKIPTQATLIIMPPHLIKQWKSEIQKFVPELLASVIVIEDPKDFSQITIKRIQDAKIVLVSWGVTTKAKYIKTLATLAGIVEPVDKPGVREFKAWYKNAIASLEDSVEYLREDPKGFTRYLEEKWLANAEEAASADVRVPSKHVTGAAYVNSDKRKTASSQNKKAAPAPKARQFEHFIDFEKIGDFETLKNVILEFFRWHRIIIDEHTYSDGLIGVVLSHILARFRWLLSGTPALGGHADIKTLASLLRINLGVDDLTALRSDIFKQKTSEYTKTELFLVHQESPSVKWREHRHQLAQLFLNYFCRKDKVNVDHIGMKEHFCLIDQSPSEKAIYLELLQHLAATDFMIVRNNDRTGDRAKQIRDVVHGSGDGKPALFMRASHFTVDNYETEDVASLLQAVILSRDKEVNRLKVDFQIQLKKTYWLDVEVDREHREEGKLACDYYIKLRDRIIDNNLGDLESAKFASELLKKAPKKYHQDDWKAFYRPLGSKANEDHPMPEYPSGDNDTHGVAHITRMAFELRTAATHLNKIMIRFVKEKRSLRFVRNIAAIQGASNLSCAHCGVTDLDPANVLLMTECGHLLASTCAMSNDCPVNGCSAYNRAYQKMNGSEFGSTTSDSCSTHGTKLDAIVELIKTFEAKNEFGLIFCQYHQTTDKLEDALKSAGVPYADLRKEATSSKVLEAFQNGTTGKGKKKARVMILNIGDANASGSNLTVANHVIFLQPYYTSGENAQTRYEDAMTQAKGRARRNGQTKEVNVYHFLTTGTIDVDYYEARHNTIIERNSGDSTRGTCHPVDPKVKWTTQLGTWFARSMKFDGAVRKDH